VKPINFAFKSVLGSPFRNAVIFLCITMVGAFTAMAAYVIQGAQENMKASLANMSRLEADIMVFPTKSAFTNSGMEFMDFKGLLGELSVIPGVAAVSPQLRLSTIENSPYCQKPELYVVAFDPSTDFTILPKLSNINPRNLGINRAIAGSFVANPPGINNFNLGGASLNFAGQLPPTGFNIDQSLFVSFDTALQIARNPENQNKNDPRVVLDAIPVILIRTSPGSDPHEVAKKILAKIPWITALDSQSFFQLGRANLTSLLKSIPGLLGTIWVLAIISIGMVFSISVNARRREIGVLRVLGSTRGFVLRSILNEGFMIAAAGGSLGAIISTLLITIFRDKLIDLSGMPFASPTIYFQTSLIAIILVLAMISVFIAALIPAWRISRQDPAIVLRK
jgi:putative ABC transport system permease protein